MKLPAIRSVSPMKALIAVGVVTLRVINYNEFYGDDSAPATSTADEAVAAQPRLVSRLPLRGLLLTSSNIQRRHRTLSISSPWPPSTRLPMEW
jgi:hypothetical protein